DVSGLKTEVNELKTDVSELKTNVQNLQSETQMIKTNLKVLESNVKMMSTEIQEIKLETENMSHKVINIEMVLENQTNYNIRLLAENHMSLVEKMDKAVHVSKWEALNEIKMNLLDVRVEKLEKGFQELKTQIA
ncbi:MAG: hypothetical protein Q4C84_16485, partial [Bacillota bacterium]|nr:hypothetical protein [Bacillota bacterium]